MEFLKNHSEIVQNEQNKIENFVKDSLIQELKKYENFSEAIKNLKNNLYSEFHIKNLINKYSIHFGGIYNFFDNKVKSISDNCPDKIKAVIEDGLFKHYNSLNFNKYDNHKYDVDFDNINYENVVIEILKYDVYFNVSIKLNDLKSEIESFYKETKIDKLDIFKLIEKREKTKNKNVNQILKVETELNENRAKSNSTKSIQESNKSILSNEENALLINIFLQIMEENGFNEKAELYRVLSIIKIRPVDSFKTKNSFRSSLEYNAMNGKLREIDLIDIKSNHISILKEYKKYLNKLSTKIEDFSLKKIDKKIEDIQTEIDKILG